MASCESSSRVRRIVPLLLVLVLALTSVLEFERSRGGVSLLHTEIANGESGRYSLSPSPSLISHASMLYDEDRTLWTAGWNARYTKYYLEAPPIIQWTNEAVEMVEREYRRLHFPKDCSTVKGKGAYVYI